MNATPGADAGTWAAALRVLAQRGMPVATFVDVGAADGYHGLLVHTSGVLPGAQIVNIDANPLYEPSLRRIHAAIGGHYRISAVSDRSGSVTLRSSRHPYWTSAAESDDPYWATLNEMRGEEVTVPCATLDDLLSGMGTAGPYALKLDIQGLEAAVLRGAPRTLAQTAVIVCETMLHEFNALHGLIGSFEFELLDITNLHRTQYGTLGWFDAVYLHRNHAHLSSPRMWDDQYNNQVVQSQEQRRQAVLAAIDGILAQLSSRK